MEANSHLRRTAIHRRHQAARFHDTADMLLDRRQGGLGSLPSDILTRLPSGIGDLFPPVLPTGTTTSITQTTLSTTTSTTATSTSTPPSSVLSTSTSSTVSSTTSSLPTTTIQVASTKSSEVIVTTTEGPATVIVTNSVIRSSSAAASSATNEVDTTSGISSGAIVGGIGAGIVAIVGILVAIAFFIRRSRKRHEDDNNFDPVDFRRSAMLLPDPPTHEDTIARGYNPRPPTMIERRLAASNPTYGGNNSYGGGFEGNMNAGHGGDNYAEYGAQSQFQSFAPGQVVKPPVTPISTDFGNRFFTPVPYEQNPFSPASSTMSPRDPLDQHYDEKDGPVVSPVLTRQASTASAKSRVSRKPSSGKNIPHPILTRQASQSRGTPSVIPINEDQRQSVAPFNDYLDLSRSSVSPYQAAQYAEISRRLNTDVPAGLTTAEVKEFVEETDRDLPPVPSTDNEDGQESPFADPPRSPSPQPASSDNDNDDDTTTTVNNERPLSSDSFTQEAVEFPIPPSRAHFAASHHRIDSKPPTLPEIHVESRVSVASYSNFDFEPPRSGLGLGQSPMGSGYPSGITAGASPFFNRFPMTPSPLNSSFVISSPGPDTNGKGFEKLHVNAGGGAAVSSALSRSNVDAHNDNDKTHHKSEKSHDNGVDASAERPNTLYSMYDPEDVYGGI